MTSFLDVSDQVTVATKLFVLAVTAAAVAPRMPFDKPWTIGGRLSHNYRKLLIVITSLYFSRYFLYGIISITMDRLIVVTESILLSLLSLLTPYILRVWMSGKINVPGGRRPGKGLEPWIYATAALGLLGFCTKLYTGNDSWWIWKKIADALSFYPVRQTLIWYNAFITSQARYPGRGSALSQVVMIGEYYALLACAMDITTKILLLLGILEAEEWSKSVLFISFYKNTVFAIYTRCLCHSILINVLDETHYFYVIQEPDPAVDRSSTSTRENTVSNNSNEHHHEMQIETIALIS